MQNIHASSRFANRLLFSSILALLLTLAGCQSTSSGAAGSSGDPTVASLRAAFISAPDMPANLSRLSELEAQALQLVDDEPLKLGSLGTAILDLYYGSLTGHYVMQRFYDHVENTETADLHANWVTKIRADMGKQGAGTMDEPYTAITLVEPVAFARSEGLVPVGSIYRTNVDTPFALLMLAKPKQGNLKNLHFTLDTVYQASEQTLKKKDGQFTPFELMAHLARKGDTAAQAAIGAYLGSHDRYEDATGWLRASSRSGNVLANNLLARVFWEQASTAKNADTRTAALDQVLENYMHAIALGSTDAAYALSVLYLNEHYGVDNVSAGLPLLQQAADADHLGAILYSAHLNYAGEQVPRNIQVAEAYYRRAAELESPPAQRAYARFLLDSEKLEGLEPHPETLTWLTNLAKQEDPEAMLLLGNLNARGVATRNNPRRAVRWYEKAVATAKQSANIVNEVAWTLAVTNQPKLRRGEYAQNIMSEMMQSNKVARSNPAYLDTWAATFAATEQFERAVEVQGEALEQATKALAQAQAAATPTTSNVDEAQAVVDELQQHLDDFSARRSLSEPVP
jgi:TPR repeat protein